MKPTIGRTVHYVNLGDKDGKYPPEIQAAMVTGVYRENDGAAAQIEGHLNSANTVGSIPSSMFVDLKVFYRTGFFDMQKVPFSETYERGHWSWPPRGEQ
jgi:hypothetical protein